MKRIVLYILAVLSGIALSLSCSEKENLDASRFYVSPASIEFGMDGGSLEVSLTTSAGSWTLTAPENGGWCSADRYSGISSTVITFTAEKNTGDERSAVFTFTSGGTDPLEFTVSQKGDEAMAAFDGETVVPEPSTWDGQKRADISYQALVYSFADGDGDRIGDISGLRDRIDYLDAMGVSAVWLSPIHPSSSYHGYDVLDYSAVNPDFGTESDLKGFIDDAHSHGIKVYLDYVLNHTSRQHPWFLDAVSSVSSPYRDFYALSENPEADIAAGKIPQIATEGPSGYSSSEWFATGTGAGAEGRMKFVLDWSSPSSPTVTVTRTDEAADELNGDTSPGGKYLYFGEEEIRRFNDAGNGIYEIVLDFSSDWGFLVRTSSASWAAGTKYGAKDSDSIIEFGKPFTLTSNASSDPQDIRFSRPLMYHSNFWTGSFADLNYGAADRAEQSTAFKAMTEAADKWVQMGVDGFRLDAVKHIYHNRSGSENPVFLKKFYDRMDQAYKSAGGQGDFYMVGEMLDEADKVAPYYAGLPAFFEFSFWYRLKWALQNGTGCYFVDDILGYQSLYSQYRQDYIEATKLSNHDEDRTGSDLGCDQGKMKLAAAVLLTAQGSPYIYQGEELGYWGTKTEGDEYVRAPVMWDRSGASLADGSLSGKVDRDMLTSGISVEAQQEDAGSILNVYRTFTRLRNTYPALARGTMEKHPVYGSGNADYIQIAAWYMVYEGQKMLVVHNFGDSSVLLDFTDSLDTPVALLGTAKVKDGGVSSQLMLGGLSSVVFDLQ